jgi:hypothetical protein
MSGMSSLPQREGKISAEFAKLKGDPFISHSIKSEPAFPVSCIKRGTLSFCTAIEARKIVPCGDNSKNCIKLSKIMEII